MQLFNKLLDAFHELGPDPEGFNGKIAYSSLLRLTSASTKQNMSNYIAYLVNSGIVIKSQPTYRGPVYYHIPPKGRPFIFFIGRQDGENIVISIQTLAQLDSKEVRVYKALDSISKITQEVLKIGLNDKEDTKKRKFALQRERDKLVNALQEFKDFTYLLNNMVNDDVIWDLDRLESRLKVPVGPTLVPKEQPDVSDLDPFST